MKRHATTRRHSPTRDHRITYLATVVTSIALVLASCGGDSAPSAADFVGIWESNDGMIVQFNEDGTLTAAAKQDELAAGALEQGTWSFDGDEFSWTVNEDNPACAGMTSRYTVTFLEDGSTKWTAIGLDPCHIRGRDLNRGPMRPHSP